MLVKICGITRVADGQCAERCGADFLGLNFVEWSKRCISPAQAQEIVGALTGSAQPVGVFADQDRQHIVDVVKTVGLEFVQLHGAEPPGLVDELAKDLPKCRFLKAFAFADAQCLDSMIHFCEQLDDRQRLFALLLDGPWGGGAGKVFDWTQLASMIGRAEYGAIREKLFLAGGLSSQNVAEAIRMVRPMGVDVATGVEERPGLKDEAKVRAFIRRAKDE